MKNTKLASLVLVNDKIGAIERSNDRQLSFLNEISVGNEANKVLPPELYERINYIGNFEGVLLLEGSKKHLQITKSVIDSTKLVNCEITDFSENEKKEEDWLSMGEEIAQIGYFEMDVRTEKISSSEGAIRILHIDTSTPFYFNDLVSLIHPNDIGRVHRASSKAISNRSGFRLEFRLASSPENVVHLLANGRVKLSSMGTPQTVLWSIQDITRQKAYEEAVEHSEARLKYAERIASMGNFEWFLKTNQFSISDEIYRILDLSPHAFDGTMESFLKFVHKDDLDRVKKDNLKHKKKKNGYFRPLNFRVVSTSGETKHLYSKGETILGPDGTATKRIGILMDVTKQEKMEKRLKAADKRKRELILQREKIGSQAIIFGQEDERQRMSMELHDGLGQILTAVYFNLNHIESLTEAYKNEEINKSLSEVFDLLQKSRTTIRAIANNLMPQVLMKFGLLGAIQALVDELFKRTSITIHLQSPDSKTRFEQSQEISIYRIIQELLSNTVKHSKASEVNLRISLYKNFLSVFLSDNGVGYDLKNADTAHLQSKGVSNIRQRIKFLSGRLNSKIKNGSRVYILIPVTQTP